MEVLALALALVRPVVLALPPVAIPAGNPPLRFARGQAQADSGAGSGVPQ